MGVKAKDIPALYKCASSVLNQMKIRRFNLHEAIDTVIVGDQLKLVS